MKTNVGIWLDYHLAKIVTMEENDDTNYGLFTVKSGLNEKHRKTGGKRCGDAAYISRSIFGHKHEDERRENLLREYFSEIEEKIQHASGVCIFGAGPARKKFLHYLLEKKSLDIGSIETAPLDYMSDGQFVSEARKYFAKPWRYFKKSDLKDVSFVHP